jgi:hypothetical protein
MRENLNNNTGIMPIAGSKERKIGKTTFIVSTSVNTEKKRDVGAIISRLIESEETA